MIDRDLYLYDQRDEVEAALARETTAWHSEEDGVALLREYHAQPESTEWWDDYTLFPLEDGCLRDWVKGSIQHSDGWLGELDVATCDRCGAEDIVVACAYDELEAAMSPDGWQVLVPEGDSPFGTARIVNCPQCTVARENLTTEAISRA